MAVASTVRSYLEGNGIPYSVFPHRRTGSSKETVRALHLPAQRLAKAVVLADKNGWLMAVLPSNRLVDVQALSRQLGRSLAVVPEYGVDALFKDCEPGAVPPLGFAYGMPMVIDECLVDQPEIYFEAGDHEEVIRIDGKRFEDILKRAGRAQFCQ